MLKKTHWPVQTSLHTDMSQLQHVEEDSLASADLHADRHVPATTCRGRLTGQRRPPCTQTCPSYNTLRKTHWPAQTSLQTCHSYLLRNLTCQCRPHETCRSYNMLRKTHWPVKTPLADQALQPSAGTGEDSSIHQADRSVHVISERQKAKH